MNTPTYFRIVIILFTIGQLITTTELLFLYNKGNFSDRGAFPWRIISLDINTWLNNKYAAKILDYLLNKYLLYILILELILLTLLPFITIHTWTFTFVALILVVCLLLIQLRTTYGGEGSDQMALILVVAIFLGLNKYSSQLSEKYCLYFIAFQSCLAYETAGVAKIISKKWRSGEAVYQIFSTGSFGSLGFSSLLKRSGYLSLFLCWNVIIMEITFPLCLVVPLPFSYIILFWGVTFHLFNAVFMGLNSFFWLFTATYPAILFVISNLNIYP
ncbi:hypothetical protein GO988_01145 [Hymenobacter sp. HMF4947]|uniref:HTTM-like domain-containing protein n=1 Tax=Hymenobacter ginkgonis TaxID=2682976 RepID=A0A7K1T954_9BACT|nr:hypothetical protein [Hymenobacter ginkgonis]MVN74923.1 hypothetical protein [Hymenobacter ginkgonis]